MMCRPWKSTMSDEAVATNGISPAITRSYQRKTVGPAKLRVRRTLFLSAVNLLPDQSSVRWPDCAVLCDSRAAWGPRMPACRVQAFAIPKKGVYDRKKKRDA
jgi:hypothetical protein